MQLCHTSAATSAVFDDPNLVSSAGLVPVLALASTSGLQELAEQHLSVPTDKGANAGLKVTSLVAGMVAGEDSGREQFGGVSVAHRAGGSVTYPRARSAPSATVDCRLMRSEGEA